MVRRRTTSLVSGLLWGLVSCSHPQLSDAGRQVLLSSTPPAISCQRLSPMVGHAYGTFLYGDTLQTPAINDLLNQAAQSGATHLRLQGTDPSAHACRALGEAFKCPQ